MISKDTSLGEEFAGKPKKLTWERIWAFSGGPFTTPAWPKKNIHTDLDSARSMGLSTVYVSATQYLGHLAELMIDLFGAGWLRGGRVSEVKFIKPVAEGDTIQTKARVRSKGESGSKVEFTMDVWCENQKGDKVLVGSAIGTLG
jgi:acyl dehydratase